MHLLISKNTFRCVCLVCSLFCLLFLYKWNMYKLREYSESGFMSNGADILKLAEERTVNVANRLRNMCNNTSTAKNQHNLWVAYSKVANTAYCPIAKVSSGFWKSVIIALDQRGKSNGYSNVFNLTGEQIHGDPSILTIGDQWKTVKTFRFTFTRNPYTRLLSGYLDKIYLPAYWAQREPIFKDLKLNGCRNDMDFKTFLSYLVTKRSTMATFDPHWRPMSSMCNLCYFRPTFVGRFETFETDRKYLIDKFNLTAEYSKYAGQGEAMMRIMTTGLFSHYREEKLNRCMSKITLVRRMWKVYQYNGYISMDASFPDRDLSKAVNVDFLLVFSFIKNAIVEYPMTSTQRANQREQALEKAFREVPIELKNQIADLYKEDFQMFSYETHPASIFGEV